MSHESVALSFKDLSSLFETLPELKTSIEDGISCGEVSSVNASDILYSPTLSDSNLSDARTPTLANQEPTPKTRTGPKTP